MYDRKEIPKHKKNNYQKKFFTGGKNMQSQLHYLIILVRKIQLALLLLLSLENFIVLGVISQIAQQTSFYFFYACLNVLIYTCIKYIISKARIY